MHTQTLTSQNRGVLIDAARSSIGHGLSHGRAQPLDPATYNGALNEPRASFVTLKIESRLRGCIGRLKADSPLIVGVSRNAYAAAFEDPRFEKMNPHDWSRTRLQISVLSTPVPMTFENEKDLLDQLRPGVDGLVLESGRCRGTFLPAVWQMLPDPASFLNQLKAKAGLSVDAWPDDVRILRYTSESIEEE
jgi:uncharacterized protein